MINFNGTIIDQNNLSSNRGLLYGDAVFETIKVSAGKILFWEDHYFRLMASMRILRMEIPMLFTPEYLEEEIFKTLAETSPKFDAYRVKLLVWRKTGGKYTPETNDVDFLIQSEIVPEPFYILNEAPVKVALFKDHYVNSGLLSTLKSTNRIINVLGSIYAKENEFDNCFLINDRKNVVEVLNGNIFLVNGYSIKTPPLSEGCLNGIIRKQILAILQKHPDYILEEVMISPFELQKADELFITNTMVGIQSITAYRKKDYVNTVAKDLIQKLNTRARLG